MSPRSERNPQRFWPPTFLEGTTFVIIAAVLAVVFWPVSEHRPLASGTVARSKVQQVSTSTLIYTTDFDDVFPPVQSMASFRSVLWPYCKNVFDFLGPTDRAVGEFNFALSGVALPSVKADFVPMYWIEGIDFDPKVLTGQVYVSSVEGVVRHFTGYSERQFFRTAAHLQFPRAVKELFPPSYMADHDPIRDLVK